jgi:hypothetical protein
MKTHLAIMAKDGIKSACGRGARMDTNLNRVDCLNCQAQEVFITEKAKADAARQAAFRAQEPKTVLEPWHTEQKFITCNTCTGIYFRYRGRSYMGHYNDWVCSNCGGVTSRLTETGMSF